MLTRRTFFKLSVATGAALVPVASAHASLHDTLAELDTTLKAARTVVANQCGPLPQSPRTTLAAKLTSALSGITAATAAWELIGVPGHVEVCYVDASLPMVAAHCAKLISYARNEQLSGRTGWEQRCANHLATIKDLINRSATGYKARAGIA